MGNNVAEVHSNVLTLHHSEIYIEDRIRTDPGSIKDFAKQLREEGQQNPITFEFKEVDGVLRRVLNTGFRRLAAAAILESQNQFFGETLPEGSPRRTRPGHVLARDIGELDEIGRLKLEMSENDSRKGFSDSERALGYAKLKRLMERSLGRSVRISELALELKESIGQVGMGLKVAEAVERDPTSQLSRELLSKPSVLAAHKHLRGETKLKELKERAKNSRVDHDAEAAIGHEDGVAFLESLENESVDLVHMDLPWGISHDEYQRHEKHELYDDSPEAALNLAKRIIPQAFRVLKNDTWAVFWCGVQFCETYRQLLQKAGFTVNPIPNIWVKSNKGGSQSDTSKVETNVYEAYLRCAKGDPRMFKKPVKNVIDMPMDLGDERDHSAQKPTELCQEILERYTFGTMFVVDPTYGSGRIFRACKKLGRRFAGAELSATNREKAINLLRRVD